MATDPSFAEFVCDQLRNAGGISVRKMFGEYALYRHLKVVALLCDNQVYVKPTPAGEAVVGVPTWGAPYPGAKPHLNASDLLDDPARLVRLILVTDEALPAPKKKAPAKAKAAAKVKAVPKAKAAAKTTAQAPRKTKPALKKKAAAKKKSSPPPRRRAR